MMILVWCSHSSGKHASHGGYQRWRDGGTLQGGIFVIIALQGGIIAIKTCQGGIIAIKAL